VFPIYDSEHSFILSKKLRPASIPLIISNATTLPPLSFVLSDFIVGAILRRIFYTINI
jgi:hypothetical protein